MIAELDGYRFILSTIDCVQRNETSTEGATGTVYATCFEEWVEHCLCPTLGNHTKGEPRSIVFMDNTSTYMDGKVATLIRSKGAYLLHAAPCSSDLNPIECA